MMVFQDHLDIESLAPLAPSGFKNGSHMRQRFAGKRQCRHALPFFTGMTDHETVPEDLSILRMA